jgi:hypothetical protein
MFWVLDIRQIYVTSLTDLQIALYSFPLLWGALLIVTILKARFECVLFVVPMFAHCSRLHRFIPIVILALIFNVTNVIGFTYAFVFLLPHRSCQTDASVSSDRDAKQRWASQVVSSGWSLGLGGIGGQILTGAVQKGVGRLFGS